MKRTEEDLYCPIKATLAILQQKWTLGILHALLPGKMRFNELASAVGGCNSRTMRDRLKTLEEEGLVTRKIIAVMPPWVEYELTPKGRALGDVLAQMIAWGKKWMARSCPETKSAK